MTSPLRLDEVRAGHDQIAHGPHVEGGTALPLAVISVDCNPAIFPAGTKDFYILCGCGWCSLPMTEMPADSAIVCEACAVRREGKDNFASFFAPEAAVRGCHVERQVELAGKR